jgi:hypothetical protein
MKAATKWRCFSRQFDSVSDGINWMNDNLHVVNRVATHAYSKNPTHKLNPNQFMFKVRTLAKNSGGKMFVIWPKDSFAVKTLSEFMFGWTLYNEGSVTFKFAIPNNLEGENFHPRLVQFLMESEWTERKGNFGIFSTLIYSEIRAKLRPTASKAS